MALGPLPNVANVVRVKLNGTNQNTPWVALFFWHYLSAPPSSALLSSFCTAFVDAFRTALLPSIAGTVAVNGAEAWDLSARDAAQASGGTAAVGVRPGVPLPTSVAAVASWKVNYRWRGGHPRTYWPAGVATDVVDGHLWTDTARTAFEAGNEAFLTTVNAITLGGAGGYLTAVRYVHTVTDPDGTKHEEYFNPPLDLRIQDVLVDKRIDTQRRRLGPDL